MAEFYAYKYSTSHLFFPKIIITLLVVLGLVIAVPKLLAALKERKNGGKRYRFFVEGYDKLKLFGTVILMILYVLALDLVGFLPASILFVLLFNVLFCGTLEKNSLLVSAVIAVVFPVAVWLIFGKLFNVTLP